MVISGTGISAFTAKIKTDYLPKYIPSFVFTRLSNGDYSCTDRGAAQDKYECDIRIYGIENTINNFISQVEANRAAGSNVLTLSTFNTEEHIFGTDIDYSSSLSATATVSRRTQGSLKGWGLPLKLQVMPPLSFTGTPALPFLRCLDIGYDADSEYTINKFDSFTRVFSYQDRAADSGSFTGMFMFKDFEMANLRQFVAVTRGSKFAMPTIFGVAHPFGRRANPQYVRMTSFVDKGMVGPVGGYPRWKAQITLVEAF